MASSQRLPRTAWLLGGMLAATLAQAQTVFINEIHYDNTGTDAGEGVEIAGPAGLDLTGWTVVPYNGAGGANYSPVGSPSTVIPDQGSGFGTVSVPITGLQNGAPDGLALVNPSSVVIQFLSYEGSFTATSGPANTMTSVDIGVSENGSNAVGTSLQLQGTGSVYTDFTWTAAPIANTFGAVNTGQTFTSGATPTVGFDLAASSVTEGGTATIGVTMTSAPSSNVTVDIADALTGGAASGTDYPVFSTVTLTFTTSGPYPQTQNVSVPTTDDPTYEGLEDIDLTLTVTSGTANTAITAHQLNIADNELPSLVINEVDYEQPGTDNAEWIEIMNTGGTAVDLAGMFIELLNGNGGGAALYLTITLPAFMLAPGGYYVVGNNAGIPNLNQLVTPPSNLIQNGAPDAIGLRDASSNLLDALSYEGTSGAPYAEMGGTLLEDPPAASAAMASIGRIPDGSDTDDNTADFQLLCTPSPGAANAPSTDLDGDLVFDCLDDCPLDPLKTDPGQCGCGVPDTDSDGDLIADCNDGCPLDPLKVTPGQCGCGVADIDSDGDLIADCVDGCPFDPLDACNLIPPGTDCWNTTCGETFTDFKSFPIPPGFFDPGSDPFDGVIRLGGGNPGGTDTQVQRLGGALFSNPLPSTDMVPIEIVALNLVSCQPIEVRYCGGGPTETWDVSVGLSPTPAPQGSMTITKTHANGGYFTSTLFVQPVFTFTRVAPVPGAVRVLDTGALMLPPFPMQATGHVPWVHNTSLIIGEGICGVNFVPGVQDANVPAVPGSSCTSTTQCSKPVGHAGPGHLHVTGHITTPCPCGACCDPGTGTCTEVASANPAADCALSGGTFMGLGTNCNSADGDAIPDSFENNAPCSGGSCVNAATCTSPTDPTRADSDGDGLGDDLDPFPVNRCLPLSAPNRPAVCDQFDLTVPGDGDADDNGDCDLCEILAQGKSDCNFNGVPDEDEPLPCTEDLQVNFRTDNTGAQTAWGIMDASTLTTVCSGGPYAYADNTIYAITCCVAPGCYVLSFFDVFGDGMCCANGIGGYRLLDENGERIIDNWDDGDFAFTSSIGLEFCLPIGTDELTIATCDRDDLLPTSVIVADENLAVSAQYGVTNPTSGYQFWLFNPDGGFNRRIFLSHANPGNGGGSGATKACHLKLSQMVSPGVPTLTDLNVRVRGRIAGVYNEFGPACRLRIDPSIATCPTTQLDNNPLNIGTTYSCGVTGKVVHASGYAGKIYASPVLSQPGNVVACKYHFLLTVPSEGYTRQITVNSYVLTLGPWMSTPLLCGTFTYDVTVRASFDCTTYCPVGATCTVQITNPGGAIPCTAPFGGGGGSLNSATTGAGDLLIYPNPNNGDQLVLMMSELPSDLEEVSVDIHDAFGRVAMSRTIAVGGGEMNHVLDLDGSLANGMYTVNLTVGGAIFTKRLVIE